MSSLARFVLYFVVNELFFIFEVFRYALLIGIGVVVWTYGTNWLNRAISCSVLLFD